MEVRQAVQHILNSPHPTPKTQEYQQFTLTKRAIREEYCITSSPTPYPLSPTPFSLGVLFGE
ncbi:hypothetical protein LC613_30095 [Nostoc sphaeroides CHAB 2801]|uniref:hypothetical protein n=1 Tax=Nostoc sphaeroides TaxID=446679 RepID=UPI001E4BD901|nr:hypothetical protein [Nostoc sphaeroides]MCC5631943.1 hypothetical protein [Nostoc sphaeroides CHAB 2801]